MERITRREFILNSSLIFGGTVGGLALGGEFTFPKKALGSDIEFPESSCGPERQTGKRVLVAYASFCGTTGGVAETIGQVLCDKGAFVDVRLVKNVKDLNRYDAAVIGSAVRSSSWWPEAIEFVEKNRETLGRIPVAYFLTCLALYNDNEGTRREAEGYIEPVLKTVPEVRPVDTASFAGVLDYGKMNMIYRMVMRSKMKKLGVPEGDFRDWNAIRSWAKTLDSMLINI